jgi:FAD/FMN-containing dehydrogenase
MKEWMNWSGSLRFTPKQQIWPRNEEDLREIVNRCHASKIHVRVAAAGHSSSPLVETPHTLIHLDKFKGIVRHDAETATLRAGMTVQEANNELQELGLALFNTGDVDVQTLAGAISTATHGSGRQLQNLAAILEGARLVDYKGEVHVKNSVDDPETMKALRVSLGALGIFSEVTVKVVPLFRLRRLEICTDVETCLGQFDFLANENRNADFYWYPRSDETKIRLLNEPGKGTDRFNFPHVVRKDEEDWVGKILPRKRELRFDEMEYAMDEDVGMACFQEIRKRILERHRKEVAWRVLYRLIANDGNYLSPHYGRNSVAISLHHNAGLPFDNYFNDIEPIFRSFGARPHWAKKHNMKAEQLGNLYPEWNSFQKIRRTLDPQNYFMNDYLKKILGE